jgi:hypothetical protein
LHLARQVANVRFLVSNLIDTVVPVCHFVSCLIAHYGQWWLQLEKLFYATIAKTHYGGP